MNVFQSFILGIVEGATEFLPISSTGHLVLASSLLGVVQSDFVKSFEIVIQLGAILAVVVLYFKSFFDTELIKRLIIAFKRWHIRRESAVVAALTPPSALSYRQAFLVGLAQASAIIPGVSRSGATIIGGLALGLNRATIVEFSFLLAVPTMAAATALSLYKGHALVFTTHEWTALAVGFVTSFVVALASIRWLLSYVRHHSFTAFGVYRIVLSLAFFVYLFA